MSAIITSHMLTTCMTCSNSYSENWYIDLIFFLCQAIELIRVAIVMPDNMTSDAAAADQIICLVKLLQGCTISLEAFRVIFGFANESVCLGHSEILMYGTNRSQDLFIVRMCPLKTTETVSLIHFSRYDIIRRREI